jgi:LCP family protein required for cell wall assembly
MLQKIRSRYRKYRRKWWFRILKIPFYFLVFYLAWALLLSTALSRAYVLEFLITIMPKTKLNGVNVLVMGIDNTKDVQRSDTIMVLHLDADQNRIGVLSIPRDSRVSIPGVGLTKINHAYAYGGAPLLKRSVIEFLGVPIDYYIKINLEGVQNLVDDMGGIDVDIPKNMYYVDKAGDLYINLKKGPQHLEGNQAMQFLRFRHDGTSDIGRIQRQQLFARSFADRVVAVGKDIDLPRIITKLSYAIETDMSGKEMTGLAVQFRDALRANHIDTGTVPGTIAMIGGVSYWKPDISQLDKTIGTVLMGMNQSDDQVVTKVETADKDASQDSRRSVTLKEVTRVASQTDIAGKSEAPVQVKAKSLHAGLVVEVLNGSGTPGEANRLASRLKKLGIRIKRTGNAGSFKYDHTILVDWKGKVDDSVILADTLSIDPAKIIVYDKQHKSIDMTIVIGKDTASKPKPKGKP